MPKLQSNQVSFESLLFEEPEAFVLPPIERTAPEETPSIPQAQPETPVTLPPATNWGERNTRQAKITTADGESEPTKKTDLARQQVEEGLKALAAELQAGHSTALIKWLDTMSRFHSYSLNNTLLIAWQRPDATHVAGFHKWKELERTVKKGEKGIMILAPIPKRVKSENRDQGGEDEREGEGAAHTVRGQVPIRGEVWGFRVAYVFDVTQTEGKDLPAFAQVRGDPAERLNRLKALVKSEGITLEYAKGLQGADGISLKGTIKIVEGLTPAREFSVLAHELAHELLHKDPKRRAETNKTVRETEAEAVAFVVCRAIGLETAQQHSDYIKLYRGDVETLSASLEAIRETSTQILSAVEKKARSGKQEAEA